MADLLNIRMEGDKALIDGTLFDAARARRLVAEAVEDIADATEGAVQRTVPVDSGQLKLHPIDRDDIVAGLVTAIPTFGGGIAVRGAGGRFTGAVSSDTAVGALIARSELRVAEEPFYAKYVHNGTGIYGVAGKPYTAKTPGKYMVFYYHKGIRRKTFRLLSVLGQPAQPYLTQAFILIDREYVPARIQLLRAQLAAET